MLGVKLSHSHEAFPCLYKSLSYESTKRAFQLGPGTSCLSSSAGAVREGQAGKQDPPRLGPSHEGHRPWEMTGTGQGLLAVPVG
jgi:hypothetical protein